MQIESIFGFTWQIEYNSDVIWRHCCLCCFWSCFPHYNNLQHRSCLLVAVVAIDIFISVIYNC